MSDSMPSMELDALIACCRAGDQEAARRLYEYFTNRLVALARVRLHQRFASRVDPEDIVQSVFRTFFMRLQAGEYEFQERDDLTKLLMRITLNKTLRQIAYQQAAKRATTAEAIQTDRAAVLDVMAHDPTPDEAIMFVDQIDHFLAKLNPEDRKIIELRLQGYRNEEIAHQLAVSDRKIRRILERVRAQAQEEDWLEG
jgi:RNA polymerase sigma-70 factor (ECF subfamily)